MPRSPNVIVFLTDQQRWDTCGAHGNPLGLTPNYDRLARAGTHAALAFTCQPVCGPARSCLQTGLYATKSGCYRNGIPLPVSARTLAHHFRAGGYTTGYIGKWHLAPDDRAGPVATERRGGYEHWLASNLLEMTSDAYDCVVYDSDEREVRLPGYRVDALTDAAIRFVDEKTRGEKPFYLFLSHLEPHHQNHRDDYPAPTGYAEALAGAGWMPPDLQQLGGNAAQSLPGYLGMVKRLDEALGRLLDALQSSGQLDNTVICFTSDHGCHFRTRNAEYKRSGHEASIRIPMVFHGPGFMGGGTRRELVSLLDVPPTLLAAAGLPVPPEMQGRPVTDLVKGDTENWPGEIFLQVSETEVGRVIRTQRWKYGVSASGLNGEAHASADRYVECFLYDLQADPWELTNLIESEAHAPVAARVRERLLARMAAAGEAVPEIESPPRREFFQRRVLPGEADL